MASIKREKVRMKRGAPSVKLNKEKDSGSTSISNKVTTQSAAALRIIVVL